MKSSFVLPYTSSMLSEIEILASIRNDCAESADVPEEREEAVGEDTIDAMEMSPKNLQTSEVEGKSSKAILV